MKENMEKVLMIANMYELFNHKSEELLAYLKAEKHNKKQQAYQFKSGFYP